MNTLTEEEIRIRAYVLWEAAGQPDGNGSMDVYWYLAEKQLLDENATEGQASQAPKSFNGAPSAPI